MSRRIPVDELVGADVVLDISTDIGCDLNGYSLLVLLLSFGGPGEVVGDVLVVKVGGGGHLERVFAREEEKSRM